MKKKKIILAIKEKRNIKVRIKIKMIEKNRKCILIHTSSTIPPGKQTSCLCVLTVADRLSNNIEATPKYYNMILYHIW